MSLLEIKLRKKTGLSPGSPVFTGEKKVEKESVTLIEYDQNDYSERIIENIEQLRELRPDKNNWIKVTGLHNIELISHVGEIFNIHPLVIEDILNVESHSKIEETENFLFIISKRLGIMDSDFDIEQEQTCFLLKERLLITFHEREREETTITERLRENKGRLRGYGVDYLAYRILDTLVDKYFAVIDYFDQKIEEIEDEIIEQPDKPSLEEIHNLRKVLIKFKRAASPVREIVNTIERDRFPVFKKNTAPFLRDISDHIKQILDLIENYREMINGLMEVYLSSASHKLNQVIKLLTIISSIFIPLTFIAGIYGMNFKNMPELEWRFGYFYAVALMAVIAGLLLIWFKKKKWI